MSSNGYVSKLFKYYFVNICMYTCYNEINRMINTEILYAGKLIFVGVK